MVLLFRMLLVSIDYFVHCSFSAEVQKIKLPKNASKLLPTEQNLLVLMPVLEINVLEKTFNHH